MYVLDIIQRASVCLFEMYMLTDFGKNLLSLRVTKKREIISILAITTICLTLVNGLENTKINLVVVPLIYIGSSLFLFKGHFFKKICISICYYLMIIGPEFLFAILLNIDSKMDLDANNMDLKVFIVTLIMKTITFIIEKMVSQIHEKRNYLAIENKVFSLLLILPIATISIFTAIFYMDIQVEIRSKSCLLIGSGALLFVNAFMFYIFDLLVQSNEKAKKLWGLYEKGKAEKQYYLQVEQINEEQRAFRHDLKKYLRIALELLKENELDAVEAMIGQAGLKLEEVRWEVFCTNKILNAILLERKNHAEKLGISYEVSVLTDIDVSFIDEIDLISIVGNLLDNAIEAAAQVPENRKVKIKIYTVNDGHFLVIVVENNFLYAPIKEKECFITRKQDKNNHGIGLHTVEKLVKEYGGIAKTEIKRNNFKISIIFSCGNV